jgi:hypothetical protein
METLVVASVGLVTHARPVIVIYSTGLRTILFLCHTSGAILANIQKGRANNMILQFGETSLPPSKFFCDCDDGTSNNSGSIDSTNSSSVLSIAKLANLCTHFLAWSPNKLHIIKKKRPNAA